MLSALMTTPEKCRAAASAAADFPLAVGPAKTTALHRVAPDACALSPLTHLF
jgi:hypothetical protein